MLIKYDTSHTGIKKKGWQMCTINVSFKSITISAALGGYLGSYVDVCEFENVLALVNNPTGGYHTSPIRPNSERVQIHSRPLARYIQEKYKCSVPLQLPAWTDGENVLLCKESAGEGSTKVHKGFIKIVEPERLRYENSIRIIGDRFCIAAMFSKQLNGRLSLFESDGVFVLLSDPRGNLVPSKRNQFGTKTVTAPRLVAYAREKFGTDTLYGVGLYHGIAFSGDRFITRREIQLTHLKKLAENEVR